MERRIEEFDEPLTRVRRRQPQSHDRVPTTMHHLCQHSLQTSAEQSNSVALSSPSSQSGMGTLPSSDIERAIETGPIVPGRNLLAWRSGEMSTERLPW